jgi:glucose-6-phosphate 1-dehydrogenase
MSDTPRHPFLHGLSKHRGAPPTVVVIFGASGDLTARKLIPAVYNLGVRQPLAGRFLPDRLRAETDSGRGVSHAGGRGDQGVFAPRTLAGSVWDRVAAHTSYVAGGYDEKPAFDRLAAHIDEIEKKLGRDVQRLFYISTPPSVFAPILQNLGASGLASQHLGRRITRR